MTGRAANGFPTGLALVACAACFAARPQYAADAVPAGDAVARALATPVSATWAGLPVRDAATRLADRGGCAVVIDRRLDPDTTITLTAEDEPLADVLAALAAATGGEVATYAGHLRLVPRGHAAPLRAADAARTAELKAVVAKVRSRLRAQAEASWPDGAVPRDLVAALAADAGLALTGLTDLPHDHFPAATLPPLRHADRIDLILAHFDRRVAWRPPAAGKGDAAYEIVPLGPAGATETAIPASPPRRRDDRPRPPADAAATYTLTVAAPLDELLTTLATRFGLVLELDAAALRQKGVAPGEIVRLNMRDASRDQLLDAILGPRGLTWRLEGRSLAVSAAAP